MQTERLCEAERMSLDRISTLPQPIIEAILCLLHTTEAAARTSILSREWRYKWTTITKLKLSHDKRCGLEQTYDVRCKSCYNIHQLLSLHQGPIHEVTLYTPEDECLEFDQIILRLSRNHTVKKLSVCGSDFCFYKLPISVFSFHYLTDLYLASFDLDHLPIFNGFRNLKSLYLWEVGIPTKTLLHLLSNCPSLTKLSLASSHLNIRSHVMGLRDLSEYCNLLQFAGPSFRDDKCTIIELFQCLPVIEHLTTWPFVFEWLKLDSVPQELPTSLVCLKYFCFEEICRVDGFVIAFLLFLIKCSPNLEKIKLEGFNEIACKKYSVVWEEYSNVWLEHLKELEIGCFSNSKPEMEFVKFILARSPKLKKVTISSMVDWDQESEMLKTLLQAPRVSPVVITVK